VRRIWTLGVTLLLVVGPSIGDLLARRADACAVAPCCIGKISKSCPMHSHPARGGFGIRSCGNDEQVVVAHQVVVVLAPDVEERSPVTQPVEYRNSVTRCYRAITPPDPPPPRLS